jgi:acyl dehydratase
VRVGDEASAAVTFTSDDVETFARLTGDRNPIHMSAAGAAAAG